MFNLFYITLVAIFVTFIILFFFILFGIIIGKAKEAWHNRDHAGFLVNGVGAFFWLAISVILFISYVRSELL